ncbi:MAG: FAD-dependent oxidoreductase [Bacteroidota bacterium]
MHIVIIGNGISGITAARHIRKLSDHQITVISAETDHFFSRTALMYIYMGHMRYQDTKPYEDWFWGKNRIDLMKDYVKSIDFQHKTLELENNNNLQYDKLILAVGSTPNKFGWPGQDLRGVQGLYSYQDLQGMEHYSEGLQHAVIVGGGLIGIEMAEMFHTRNIPVTFLVREGSYWNAVLPPEESEMINRHILDNHIDLRLKTELKEILSDENGRARAVITNTGEEIACGFVGLTAGVRPNTGFLKDSGLEIGRGILVNEHLETNIPDVYAIGDCAQARNPLPSRRPVEAIWYTGRMMGETVAYNICKGPVAYDPGIWFNSAKFFDIEYQVYGTVLAKAPDHHKSIYWEHPEGKLSVRVIYDENDETILGFNLMGVRFRHEVCEKWVADKTPVQTVLRDLSLAHFDPEFYTTYQEKLIETYRQQSGETIIANQKGVDQVAYFLGNNDRPAAAYKSRGQIILGVGLLLLLIGLALPFTVPVDGLIMMTSGFGVAAGLALILMGATNIRAARV